MGSLISLTHVDTHRTSAIPTSHPTDILWKLSCTCCSRLIWIFYSSRKCRRLWHHIPVLHHPNTALRLLATSGAQQDMMTMGMGRIFVTNCKSITLIYSIITSDWQTGHVLGRSKLPSSLHLTVKLDCFLLCRKKLPRSHSYVTSPPNSTSGEEGDTILWWMENQISGKRH